MKKRFIKVALCQRGATGATPQENLEQSLEMVERAAAAGVRLAGLSDYYLARPELCPPRTVVVGYGALADGQVEAAAAALRAAWLG